MILEIYCYQQINNLLGIRYHVSRALITFVFYINKNFVSLASNNLISSETVHRSCGLNLMHDHSSMSGGNKLNEAPQYVKL